MCKHLVSLDSILAELFIAIFFIFMSDFRKTLLLATFPANMETFAMLLNFTRRTCQVQISWDGTANCLLAFCPRKILLSRKFRTPILHISSYIEGLFISLLFSSSLWSTIKAKEEDAEGRRRARAGLRRGKGRKGGERNDDWSTAHTYTKVAARKFWTTLIKNAERRGELSHTLYE